MISYDFACFSDFLVSNKKYVILDRKMNDVTNNVLLNVFSGNMCLNA